MIPHWEDNHEWIFIKIRNIWKISEIKKRNKDEKIFFFFLFILYLSYWLRQILPDSKNEVNLHYSWKCKTSKLAKKNEKNLNYGNSTSFEELNYRRILSFKNPHDVNLRQFTNNNNCSLLIHIRLVHVITVSILQTRTFYFAFNSVKRKADIEIWILLSFLTTRTGEIWKLTVFLLKHSQWDFYWQYFFFFFFFLIF